MRPLLESSFQTADNTRIFYRHWPAENPKGAIVVLHRGHEHSGRNLHIAQELNLPDFAIFAWDARAHGLSDGDQGPTVSVATFIADLDQFTKHITAAHGIPTENIALLAQSLGAVYAAAWVHDYAPKIRCMVLASPAFKVKLYVPFARPSLALWHSVAGHFFVQSYVQGAALTHDKDRAATYGTDPLIKRPISAKVLLGLYETAERIVSDAQAIHTPTQLLISGSDWVVHQQPQHDFLKNLGSKVKESHTFPGFRHDTLGETDRHLPLAKAREFITRQFAQPPSPPDLSDADKHGYTHNEYEWMKLPAQPLAALNFGLTKLSMKTGGQLSAGIRLGTKTGFDSGATLDYVYRNQPTGITPLGKAIDFGYLNAIGWRGIRIRKQHIEALIAHAAGLLRTAGLPVHLVDIAAGHGRYALDAASHADSILLRDYDPANVEQGRKRIAEAGLQHKARFEPGDAFNIAPIEPSPTLAIISGLFELFPSNDLIRQALTGLAKAMPPDGYLIYTGQPWHPQLEMIARTLSSHRDGQPWIMRRRVQAELDQLVEAAGFQKVSQKIDEFGIFTVSLARRHLD